MWATVSQWREDQATNLWLGLTQGLTRIPVGLISSVNLPNPNGMVILGFFLSRLPNMLMVSTFLGCLQAAIILGICWVSFRNANRVFFVASAPLLTSMVLRGSSVEFWNQWLLTTANLMFLLWAVLYLRKPTLSKISALIGLVLFSPALYLGGLVNGMVMAGIGIAVVILMPPENWRKNYGRAIVLSLGIVGLCIWLVWLPFFQVVTVHEILATTTQAPLVTRVWEAIEAIVRFPFWGTVLSSDRGSFAIPQSSRSILSPFAYRLVDITLFIQLTQAMIALALILFVVIRHLSNLKSRSAPMPSGELNARRLVFLSIAYLLASYALSPLLGGAMWATGERRDQVVQFLPFLILFWFLTPFAVPLPEAMRKLVITGTSLLVIIYSGTSIIGGIMVVQSHLSYRGDYLSNADVPLVQKMQAVDFIAQDWESISTSKVIPVDYRLGGGKWDWITEFGHKLDPWYDAPYTIGRDLDYDLLRRYGLKNVQEGVQERSFGTERYLVTYAFEPAPDLGGYHMSHHLFGRLRVTVVDFTSGQIPLIVSPTETANVLLQGVLIIRRSQPQYKTLPSRIVEVSSLANYV